MKAMVLSAGFGTRLGSLTRDTPKPMLPLGNHPLLAFLLGHLHKHGFDEIAINLHFRPETIRTAFGDGSKWGMQFRYSHEPELLGTAGGVRQVRDFFEGASCFLIQYGDILTDHDLTALMKYHRERHALATLLIHQRAVSNSAVSLDADGRIVGFLERPSPQAREGTSTPWVNSGICVASPELLDHIPANGPSDLPRDVFVPLVASRRLFAMPLVGFRCAIDSPERLELARSAVASGHCRVEPLPVRCVP